MLSKLFFIFLIIAGSVAVMEPVKSEGCGVIKYCLHYPSSCTSDFSTCTSLITWQRNGDDAIIIEMYRKTPDNSKKYYIGLAYSTDQDMANNPCEVCFVSTAAQATFKECFLTGKQSPTGGSSHITNPSLSYGSGVLQCRYVRPLITSTPGTLSSHASNQYYILGALGEMQDDSILKKHEDKMISAVNYQFPLTLTTTEAPSTPTPISTSTTVKSTTDVSRCTAGCDSIKRNCFILMTLTALFFTLNF